MTFEGYEFLSNKKASLPAKSSADENRGKVCRKVRPWGWAADAQYLCRLPQMDPFHNCRAPVLPDPAVCESGYVRTFCYRRQGVVTPTQPNPIKRTLPDKVVLHHVSLRDDEAIVGFSANDPATRRWCHVGAEEEKGGWSETEATFTLHLPPLPLQSEEKKSFPVFNEVSTSFQRFPFSRADSPADPGGPGADSERQRVCEEDQHGHREDLHPSRVQLLCWWHQGSRCLSGNAIYHISYQISSVY